MPPGRRGRGGGRVRLEIARASNPYIGRGVVYFRSTAIAIAINPAWEGIFTTQSALSRALTATRSQLAIPSAAQGAAGFRTA